MPTLERPLCRNLFVLVGLLLFAAARPALYADAPRVLEPNKTPQDARLGKLKDLNGYFPFTPSPNKEAWEARAQQVRRRILVSTGLWPMPKRTPANAVVHGKVDRDQYTVERVYLEVRPSNLRAIGLYESIGFNEFGRRPNFYPARRGREDAIVMAMELLAAE